MAVIETDMWRAFSATYAPYYMDKEGVDKFKFSLISEKQPKFVCMDCANEYSYWRAVGYGYEKGAMNTPQPSHTGVCDCCGKKEWSVYDIKNVGYFYKGWENRKLRFL